MLYRLSVWLHLIAACAWVGGIVFFAAVLVPVVRQQEPGTAAALVRAVGRRFRSLGWFSLGVLALTGVTNLLSRYSPSDLATAAFWTSPFGTALMTKLALVAAVIVVTIAHDVAGVRAAAAVARDPGARETAQLRRLASWLGRIDLLLALLVLFAALVLVRGWP
jgi:uncharacterized membrane protein